MADAQGDRTRGATVLCEISEQGNFLTTWAALAGLGLVFTGAMSAALFRRYYWKPTYEQWRTKSSPAYPPPTMVRSEILTFLKGVAVVTIPPALALSLVSTGWSKAYCGVGDLGWGYLIGSFFVVWIGSDFYQYWYHRLGHEWRPTWRHHKHHHTYFNPTPFAVIADESLDNLMRGLPMLFFPLLMPTNLDMLFGTYALFFYAYGVYLHWGHELAWPDAHHPWLNTSFQHYLHHRSSTLRKPYSTGFFFRIWDHLFGSAPDEEVCSCAKCACERGERTPEAFARVEKPDYSVLLDPSFWLPGAGSRDGSRRDAARSAKA